MSNKKIHATLARKINTLTAALLRWFAQEARDLPWRRTREPYAVWVSEIMLQQTQVKTVIPYWERWMRALPDARSVAEAKPETLHKLWEGLGYYTRVRNLQQAARVIVAEHGGKFPRDYETILALPGIGRYTAGAIASIAFNEPRAILDGNVVRVLTRIFGVTENARENPAREKLWEIAEQLVLRAAESGEREACSQLNQSLMELGAMICTPRQPQCPVCPARNLCAALKTGRVGELPNLGARAAATARRFVAFVVEHKGRFLVRQRPAGVVNAHLWEFPNVEVNGNALDLKGIAKASLGSAPDGLKEFCTIKHSITRYRMTLAVWRGEVKRRSARSGRWLKLEELDALAFSSAHRKVLGKLTGGEAGGIEQPSNKGTKEREF